MVENLEIRVEEVEKLVEEGGWEGYQKWCGEVKRVLSGARMQACIRRTLEFCGWTILPLRRKREVQLLDLHGVDLVALNQGLVYFLDIKARKRVFGDDGGLMIEPRYIRNEWIDQFLDFVFENISETEKKQLLEKGISCAPLNVFLSSDQNLVGNSGLFREEVRKDLLDKLVRAKMWFWG